jgi:hypothetical protein
LKYTEAWASVVQQNLNLKRVTILFAVLSLILSIVALKLAAKDVLVLERGCFTKATVTVNDKHTTEEIDAFLKEALPQRFNSTMQPTDGYLSSEEMKLRDQEQKELKSRNMSQLIAVRSVLESAEGFVVDADRLIAVGEVRSALRFPLKVRVESKARSLSNPYGLLLSSVQTVDKGAQK